MNMTPLRIRALELIKQHPNIYAGSVAEALVDRRWWPQASTRWGVSYLEPMVRDGLLLKDSHVDFGGARYRLTSKGEEALA